MLSDAFSPVFDGATLVGDASKNKLTGTDLNDQISGLGGNDQLRGLDGMDALEGDIGKDKLFGGDGADYLSGGDDKDKLFGGEDNDWLSGGEGKDVLKGDEGNDTLVGGEGNDTLKAGTGDDLVDGGSGDDAIYLGEGSDVVVLSSNNGYDDIKDFKVGTDKIQLHNLTFENLELIAKGNRDTIVRINQPGHRHDGESIAKFKGVSVDQLSADDFILSNTDAPKNDDGPVIENTPPIDNDTPQPDSSTPDVLEQPVDPSPQNPDSPPSDESGPNTPPVDEPPASEETIWRNSFADSDWMDAWDVRSGKSWGFNNMEVIPEAPGNSEQALRVYYPAGSASPSVSRKEGVPLGGTQFYADLDIPPQDELRLSYDVRFSENFNFVKGGKLPGLFGGEGASGGNIPDGTDGFSTRFMWRRDGDGEMYAYLPTSKNYGTSIGRGSWQFEPGDWHRIEQEVKLNHPDRSDGEIRVWVNNKLVIEQTGLQFRTENSLKIDGVFFSTFFGGGDSSWSTPKDVHIDFANFAVTNPQ